MLTGYRMMWVVVMFDLPVGLKAERKAANAFRNSLLDIGFKMIQLSVYIRMCTSPSQINTYCKSIELFLPKGGNVSILQFTDKQYERVISFHGKTRDGAKKNARSI